jgi:hypothetical protein
MKKEVYEKPRPKDLVSLKLYLQTRRRRLRLSQRSRVLLTHPYLLTWLEPELRNEGTRCC